MKNIVTAISRMLAFIAEYAAYLAENALRAVAGLVLLPFKFSAAFIPHGGDEVPGLPSPPTHDANPAPALSRAPEHLHKVEMGACQHPEAIAWMWAATRAEARDSIDLSGLEPHIREWLESLDGDQLKAIRLAGLRRTIAHIKGQIEINGLPPIPASRLEREPRSVAEVEFFDRLRARMEAQGIAPRAIKTDLHDQRFRTA